MTVRQRVRCFFALAAFAAACGGGGSKGTPGAPTVTPPPIIPQTVVMIGAGDIGDCSTLADAGIHARDTARMMDTTTADAIFTAGDNAYPLGSSDDFKWVSQAIAIHREVGGDLADVLDTVSHTIRERNGIRRQVKALSAEGKMSGYVLMMLPIGITAFLMISNPHYIGALATNIVGWAMIAAAVIFMTVGGLWLRKVVSFKF